MFKISGQEIAQKIIDDLKGKTVPQKFLAVFWVGNNPASEKFIKQKEKTAKELGVDFRVYKVDESVSNDQLREKIRQVASSKKCGGVVLQLPLPEHLNPFYIINTVSPEKDVEVFSDKKFGSFYYNRSKILPPSVETVKQIIDFVGKDVSDFKKVAVIGQGVLVGKPISAWFSGKVGELYSLDKGFDEKIIGDCDLIVLGTGSSGILKKGMFKKEAGIIDFGYGFDEKEKKVRGDFDDTNLKEGDALFYTPTPKGTGPILVASLFKNFFELNKE